MSTSAVIRLFRKRARSWDGWDSWRKDQVPNFIPFSGGQRLEELWVTGQRLSPKLPGTWENLAFVEFKYVPMCVVLGLLAGFGEHVTSRQRCQNCSLFLRRTWPKLSCCLKKWWLNLPVGIFKAYRAENAGPLTTQKLYRTIIRQMEIIMHRRGPNNQRKKKNNTLKPGKYLVEWYCWGRERTLTTVKQKNDQV